MIARWSETIGLAAALVGLALIPGIYVLTGFPQMADYPAAVWAVSIGAIAFAAALWMFRWSHKWLGRYWSVTLEIRDRHRLICDGPYALVRHPMYTSFLLMAVGQALLLPNWIVGISGFIGLAVLVVPRINKEETMMIEVFGEEYISYMGRTKRIVPFIY